MRLAQANLITKIDFDAELSRINRKITENKTENALVKNELNKLKALIEAISLTRVILKKMILKSI